MTNNNISKESYNGWHKLLLSELETLSSKDWQKALWVEGKSYYLGKGPYVDNYGETVNSYFHDLNLENIKQMVDLGFLTKNEYDILLPFHKAYSKFREDHDDWCHTPFTIDRLHSKEWKEIISLAGEVLKKLKKNDRK